MQHERNKGLIYLSASVLPSSAANAVHVMKMCAAFERQGLDVELIGRKNGSEDVSDSELRARYGVSGIFSIRRVGDSRLFGYRGRYVLGVLFGGWVSRKSVIYTRVPKLAAMASVLKRSCVLELHHPPSREDEEAVRKHLRSPCGGTLVVITQTLRDWAVQTLGARAENVVVAPDGADPIDPEIAPALPRSGRLRIGYLGHLYPGKGMELIEKLVPRFPEADFLIVGGNIEDVILWENKLAHVSNIRFVGQVPHGETASWLKSFDIAVLPNQRHVGVSGGGATNISPWTSPLKAFEYMAAGLPIVASDQDNLREVLVDGETSFLRRPEDVEGWVEAIELLLNEPKLRERLGRNALERFMREYSWDIRAKKLIECFA